jgi:hypothetical protein
MRASEFLNEDKVAKIPDIHIPAINDLAAIDGVGQFYGLYRMMIVAAGHPDGESPIESVLGDVPVAMPYTDHDKELLIKSAKRMGGKMRFITGAGSEDAADSNIKSPIPQNSGKITQRK